MGVPAEVFSRFATYDHSRTYLATPFDSFWYLGERLAWQTSHPQPVVPVHPPRVLFEQTPDIFARYTDYEESQSDTLLLMAENYHDWAWRSLACGPIEVSFVIVIVFGCVVLVILQKMI